MADEPAYLEESTMYRDDRKQQRAETLRRKEIRRIKAGVR